MMKKISRSSSFCMCFEPVVMENGLVFDSEEPSEGVKQVLSSSAVDVVSSDDKDTDGGVGSFSRKNKIGRRSFSRYVKAVFFETSLMKKVKDKKLEKKLQKTLNSLKTKSKKKSKIAQSIEDGNISSVSILNHKSCTPQEEDNESTSNCSTLSSGFASTSKASTSTNSASSSTTTSRCSSSSSRSLISRSNSSLSERPEIINTGISKSGKGRWYGGSVGTILLLVSLFVLVLWGKICAILCTSTWLFFAYRRSSKPASSGNNAVDRQFPEIGIEKYYKKKVIMEGLLERNHSRSCYKP